MQTWEVVISYKNGSCDRAFINSLDHSLDSIRNMNVAVGEEISAVHIALHTILTPTEKGLGIKGRPYR